MAGVTQVAGWLANLGLQGYTTLFEQHRIGFDVLPALTDQDLEKLGVPLGDRKRLLKAAVALSQAAPDAQVDAGASVQRRQVAVLFLDIASYTRLVTALGAESAHDLMQRFYKRVSALIESHGGTVERYIGDAVMAVFGFPVAHSNDAERAVASALAIHELMPQLSAEVGHAVSVHVGVANGLVVASREDDTARTFATVGDTVNLGARLASLAPAGGTVVSDTVFRAVARPLQAESLGELQVKGFDQPVRGWRVLGWDNEEHARVRTPLVGRTAELQQFDGVCRACSESGTGNLVYLRGEAGIGKTRLVEEFEARAAAWNFGLHKAMALDFGLGRARDAAGQLAASLLDIAPIAPDAERLAGLNSALERQWLKPDELAYAHDLIGVPLDRDLRATYDSMDSGARSRGRSALIDSLLARRSAERPLLVVVEDIHWADATLLSALADAAATTASTPVVLVLTSRREGDPVSPAWRAQAGPALAMFTIDLAPLRLSDALKLADAIGFKSDPMAAQCVARAEGNPLFLEQLLRAAQSGEASSVPDSIQSIVLARLDRLPVRERRAAQAASVPGQRFSLALLRHLLGDPSYECSVLVAENLVRPLGDEYLFYHALIWESIYLSLLRDQKREWHAIAAQWYADKEPALAAEHLDRAEDPGAARAYLQAARAEKHSYRSERALALLDRGLELVQVSEERFALLTERGALTTELGRADAAIDDFRVALEIARDDSERAHAWLGLAAAMRMSDRYDEALHALERAQQLADPTDHAALAQIHDLRGNLHFPLGRIEECMQEHRLALEHARRARSEEWETRALGGLADALFASGRFVSAYDRFEECVRLAMRHGARKVEAANLAMQGNSRFFLMRPPQPGIELCERAVEMASQLGQPRVEIVAHHGAMLPYIELNDPGKALAHAQAALDLSRAIRSPRFEGESIAAVALCVGLQGDRRRAGELLEEALEAMKGSMTYWGPVILGGLAQYADDEVRSEKRLREGELLLAQGCITINAFFFNRTAIDLKLELGDLDAALRYVQSMEDAFAAEAVPLVQFTASRARALIAFKRGSRDLPLLIELERLQRDAQVAGLNLARKPIDAAIAAMQSSGVVAH